MSLPRACLLRAGRATSNILVLIPPAEKDSALSWYPDTDGLVPKSRETAKQGFLPLGRGASPGPPNSSTESGTLHVLPVSCAARSESLGPIRILPYHVDTALGLPCIKCNR